MSDSIPSHFCPVPWKEVYVDTIGDAHACCLEKGDDPIRLYNMSDKEKDGFFNTKHFTSLRQSILNNEKSDRCTICWTTEAQGLRSGRHQALIKYAADIPQILKEQSITVEAPVRMDLRYSSRCNIQCKMCCPSNSNQISGLVRRMQAKGLNTSFTERAFRDDNQGEFLNRYIQEHDSVVELLFAGGEPFVMPEFDQFLTMFIESGRCKTTRLHILNNLTAVKDSLLEKLAHFQSVDLSCSMDGIGEEFEFQRFPSNWNKVKTNFEKILKFSETHRNVLPSLTPCISHLNVRCLADYIRYVHTASKRKIYNSLNLVIDPGYLDYRFIPLHYRRPMAEDLKEALTSVKDRMYSDNYENWFRFSEALGSEELEMNLKAKVELRDAVEAWEFEQKPRFRELYPWANELLAETTYRFAELSPS